MQEDGVELNVSDLALKAIANRAKERKTGARSLRSILEEILNPTMFDLPEKEVNQITLDINNNDFVVNYNKIKKRGKKYEKKLQIFLEK